MKNTPFKFLTAAGLVAAAAFFYTLATGPTVPLNANRPAVNEEIIPAPEVSDESLDGGTAAETPAPYPFTRPEKPQPPYQIGETINESVRDLIDSYGNTDIVGTLKIEGTSIDYPVVQSGDNHYYLNRNIYGAYSAAGAIYMDYENDIAQGDRNTILYGHNMKANTMFHALRYYRERDFYENHKYIQWNTLYEEGIWEVFAFYDTHIDFNYIQVHFDSDAEFMAMVDTMSGKSLYDTGINVAPDDRVLSLSTCTNTDNNRRYVLNAKLISVNGRDYEDIKKETAAYEAQLKQYHNYLLDCHSN